MNYTTHNRKQKQANLLRFATSLMLALAGTFFVMYLFTMTATETEMIIPAEAGTGLFAIKERLRIKYLENGSRIDPGWTLADIINPEALHGRFYSFADYEIVGPITESKTVVKVQRTGSPEYFGSSITIIDISAARIETTWSKR